MEGAIFTLPCLTCIRFVRSRQKVRSRRLREPTGGSAVTVVRLWLRNCEILLAWPSTAPAVFSLQIRATVECEKLLRKASFRLWPEMEEPVSKEALAEVLARMPERVTMVQPRPLKSPHFQ